MISSRLVVALTLLAALTLALPAACFARGKTMPYREAGLTDRQAAAHLLDRFTFGPRPGDVEAVVAIGLETWFDQQLARPALPTDLRARLAQLPTLKLNNEDILRDYPSSGTIRRMAENDGYLDPGTDAKAQYKAIRAYRDKRGYGEEKDLLAETIANKLLRAVHSPSQVEEVMVDFWFNHFYVSYADDQCRPFIGTYERDAIRPNVFEKFERMLEASARHRAMLLYLDNAQSSAAEGALTTVKFELGKLRFRVGREGNRYDDMLQRVEQREAEEKMRMDGMSSQPPRRRGINENYARELLELHTLGVDGGYTQQDVEGVARALTGWTVLPASEGYRKSVIARMRYRTTRELGYWLDGDFYFNASIHDAADKDILGQYFAEGGGMEEGRQVLVMLARHPSTAQHIARKLAVRFVSDDPPERFVRDLAAVFREKKGDMKALLWQIVESPEFWAAETRSAKIKTPFELVVSGLRALDARLDDPAPAERWIDRMGQRLYRYEAPTGFPDRAAAWVSASSLIDRMDFGLSLATGAIGGMRVDLLALNGGLEPESLDAALQTYAALLMPERDLDETMRVLRPMAGRRDLPREIRERAKADAAGAGAAAPDTSAADMQSKGESAPTLKTLAQVVGLILGSPEFQRR